MKELIKAQLNKFDLDKKTYNILFDFLNELSTTSSEQKVMFYSKFLGNTFNNNSIDNFDWDFMINHSEVPENFVRKMAYPFTMLCTLLVYLLNNNLYKQNDKDDVYKVKEDLEYILKATIKNMDRKIRKGLKPWNIIKMKQLDKRLANEIDYVYVPGASKEICELISDYFNKPDEVINPRIKEFYDTLVLNLFVDSLENKFKVEKIEDFNDDVFEQQFFYFVNNKYSLKIIGFIIKFHIYIQYKMGNKLSNEKYKKFDVNILKYNMIMSKLIEGYKIVNYSVYDKPQYYDKLIIKENNMDLKSTKPKDMIIPLDFSEIKSEYLKKVLLDYFWKNNTNSLSEKRHSFYIAKDFLILYEKRKSENITKDNFIINIEDITSYKQNIINDENKSDTKRSSGLRKFIKFLEDNKICAIEAIYYRLLATKENDHENGYKEAFTKEEMEKITNAMKEEIKKQTQMQRADLYQLYLYAFSIFSISDIRISSIFALTTDCIKTTLNSKGNVEYKVVVQSKTSGSETEEYNITKYVKKIIDEVIAYTNKFRESCPTNLKDILFICQNQYRGGITQLRVSSFGEYFTRILENYNIRKLRPAAVRNYYMQNVSNYVFSNGYDKSLIEKLTNHSLQVHLNHYDDVNIMDFCQNFYNVEIGNVYLKGEVKEENEFPKQQIVVNGCGHCSLKKCALIGKLDCFMCEHFVTTLDCIPYYKNEIAKIDDMIKNQKIKHEQEFLISKKKLLVAYLEKLMELEAEKNEENK